VTPGTYQAAQVGISLGAKGPDSRKFLGDLLGVLESLKANIAATDAAAKDIIDSEVESAAYVETFALKVFGVADSEDRSGKATR
jgi:vacuolar protein sorting-associated protein VTA1